MTPEIRLDALRMVLLLRLRVQGQGFEMREVPAYFPWQTQVALQD